MTKKQQKLLLTKKDSSERGIYFVELETNTSFRAEPHLTVSITTQSGLHMNEAHACLGIRYSLYKVTVSEVEKELKALPYISEAYVLPIMDYEVRELVGAIVRLRDSSNHLGQESGLRNPDINLCKIRQDLSSKLEIYKLPTILRILRAGEGVPLSVSSKVLKPKLREMYFKLSGYRPKDYSEPGVEFWEKGVDLEYIHKAGGFASS